MQVKSRRLPVTVLPASWVCVDFSIFSFFHVLIVHLLFFLFVRVLIYSFFHFLIILIFCFCVLIFHFFVLFRFLLFFLFLCVLIFSIFNLFIFSGFFFHVLIFSFFRFLFVPLMPLFPPPSPSPDRQKRHPLAHVFFCVCVS